MSAIPTAAELDRRFGIPGTARVSEGNGGMIRIEIESSLCTAEMYLHGAQVTSWKPANNDELLFLSSKSRWEEGKAIRGGIPICFPWFRGKADDPHAPAHGFVRTKAWQLDSVAQNHNSVIVSMSTESSPETEAWWPGHFRSVYRVSFGSELVLELECTNTGRTELRFEEALHTYNRIGDVEDASIEGLTGVHFLDNTDSNKEKTQLGNIKLSSQTDNAYLDTQAPVEILDPGMNRRIQLKKTNSRTTVVWNPWRNGAQLLQDLGDGEWRQFLCVEASNILDAAITLSPGQKHNMTAVLRVAPL